MFSSILDLLYSKPNFFIIGAQKCGTTSLYDYLVQHPQVLSARYKELHFFDYYYQKGEAWYRRRLPSKAQMREARKNGDTRVITGEATPCYMVFPQTPERVYRFVPEVKLIVLLRNPVDRAFSQYQMNRAKETVLDTETGQMVVREPLSFGDAIAAEDERMKTAFELLKRDPWSRGQWFQMHSYKTRGLYAQQLRRWLQFFPREQMLILDSSKFYKNTDEVYARVLDFLSLQPFHLQQYEAKLVGGYREKMSPETRAQLVEYFKPHNDYLYELLGQRFRWDKYSQ